MALWPNTDMNTVSAAGGVNLPGRSHATAFLSVASLTNDNALLPYTINSALVSPALDRARPPTSRRRVTPMNYTFTSRPVTCVWFSAALPPVRIRQPHGAVQHGQQRQLRHRDRRAQRGERTVRRHPPHLRRGCVVHAGDVPRLPRRLHARRRRPDLPHRRADDRRHRARLGGPDRARLADPSAASTSTRSGAARRSIRSSCWRLASSRRCGSTTSPTATRIASTRSCTVTPAVASSRSTRRRALGRQDYPGTNFGLRNNDNHVYSVGFDFVPSNAVSLGASYGYEKYTRPPGVANGQPVAGQHAWPS